MHMTVIQRMYLVHCNLNAIHGFSDVMCRGHYPAYIYRTWKEEDCAPVMLDGDEQCLQANTADYIAFSYYRSAVYKKKQKCA